MIGSQKGRRPTQFFRNIFNILAILCAALCSSGLSWAKRGEEPSVFVDAPWSQRLKLLPNRGQGAVNILEHTLKVLDPDQIEKLPGFESFSQTRITLMSYDFRSAEVVQALKRLLELGVSVQVVSDPSTVKPTRMPSKKEQESWSEHQRRYFLHTYDGADKSKGKDGVVTKEDIAAFNQDKRLGLRFWSELEKLQKVYGSKLDLVTSPDDLVPVDDQHRFPRLQHIKALMIQFAQGSSRVAPWGPPVYLRMGSSNFTETCMDPRGRVKATDENIDRYYSDPDKADRVAGSRGHVQFNVEMRALAGEDYLAAVSKPLFALIDGFKKGKHFDELAVNEKRLPKVIFSDGTTFQAFYSEGISRPDRDTEDPVETIYSHYMSNPAMKLQEALETQFVFTHHRKARYLRKLLVKALEDGTLEDVYIVVDGSFSTIRESAYDDLFFSEEVSVSETLSGRGILRSPRYPEKFDWRNVAYSYHGIPALVSPSRKSDKMHSKLAAYKYIDDHGSTVFTIVAGSGNSSTNAGRGNSDVFMVLETRDPTAWDVIEQYRQGVKIEEKKRLLRLSEVWLVRALGEAFSEQIATLVEKDPKYLQKLSNFLSRKASSRLRFADLFDPILKMKAASPYGQNLKAIIAWVKSNPKLAATFTWADFDLMLRLADSTVGKTKAFVMDLRYRWVKGVYPVEYEGAEVKRHLKNFATLARKIDLASHGPDPLPPEAPGRSRADAIIQKNMAAHCEFFLNTKSGFHPMEIYRLIEVGE